MTLRLICWLTSRMLRHLALVCERAGWVTEPKVFRSAARDVEGLPSALSLPDRPGAYEGYGP